MDSSKEFNKYATKHMGISSMKLYNYSSKVRRVIVKTQGTHISGSWIDTQASLDYSFFSGQILLPPCRSHLQNPQSASKPPTPRYALVGLERRQRGRATFRSPRGTHGGFEKDSWGLREGSLGSAKLAFPEVQHGVSK